MTELATAEPRPTISEEDIDRLLERMADSYGQQARSPIMHRPCDLDLDYEDLSFPASDGTALEAWYVPAQGSDKLIIANHPRGFSRAGMPSHVEPWHSQWAPSGNGFEVDFIPDLRLLHDAGYNVLTYDLRNHGHSAAANGGIVTSGIFEQRDVLGALNYVRTREDTRTMTIGLFSRCLGANSTLCAMAHEPEAFDGIRCLVACQPLTPQSIAERLLELAGVPVDRIEDLDRRMVLRTSVSFAERAVVPWAATVRLPSYLYQVRDDVLTRESDVQGIFDAIPASDKRLRWIENSTARWDGYVHFQREPAEILDWFATHMT